MSHRSLQTQVFSTVNINKQRKRRKQSPNFQQTVASASNAALTEINTTQIQNHINLCRKLFFGKKITCQNAWDVKIIDYINYFVSNNLIDSDTMLIAVTTLDICIKVYEYKVEYLENEITQLAAHMQVPLVKKTSTEYIEKPTCSQRKSKKARRGNSIRTKIVENLDGLLLAKVPKVASVHFIENLNLYASNFENMSTTKTLTNHSAHKLQLLNNVDCGFISYDEIDPTAQVKLFPRVCLNVESILICPELRSFDIYEEHNDCDKILANELNEYFHTNESPADISAQIVADDVAPMDIESNDIHNDIGRDKRKEIKSFCPTNSSNDGLASSNTYFNTILTAPSHWKHKLVRPLATCFSANIDKARKKVIPHKQRRKMMIDKIGPIRLSDTILNKINFKRKCRTKSNQFDIKRCTLYPNTLEVSDILNFETTMLNLATRNSWCNEEHNRGQLHGGCRHLQPTGSNSVDEGTMENNLQKTDFLSEENLSNKVSLLKVMGNRSDMVTDSCVPYARYAKKINMRKLKHIFLECLFEGQNNNPACHISNKRTLVKSTKLTDINKQLAEKLPIGMKTEVTLAVGFFTLLYLATEQTLTITGFSNLNDVTIMK